MAKVLLVSPKLKEVSYKGKWFELDKNISLASAELDSFLFKKHHSEYFIKNDIRSHFRDYKNAISPTGLLSIAGSLREDGHNVEYVQVGSDSDEKIRDLVAESDLIGIGAKCTTLSDVVEYSKYFKEINPKATIIVGGPHVTASKDLLSTIAPQVDIFVRGEGEEVSVSIARDPKSKSLLKTLSGIYYRNNGTTIDNPGINVVDITRLPPPAFDLVSDKENTQLYLEFSRGCKYNCHYCVESSKRREKTLEQIVNDLRALEQSRRHSTIHIVDSDFAANNNFVRKFRKAISIVKPTNHFIVQTRISRMSPKMIKELYSSNIFNIYFGLESFSDSILKKVNKGSRWDDIFSGLVNLSNHAPNLGSYRGNFIQGLPGVESEASREEEMLKRNMVLSEGLIEIMKDFIFMPVPGSDIYERPRNYNLNFSDSYHPDLRTSIPQYSYGEYNSDDIFIYNMNLRRIRNNYIARKYDFNHLELNEKMFKRLIEK